MFRGVFLLFFSCSFFYASLSLDSLSLISFSPSSLFSAFHALHFLQPFNFSLPHLFHIFTLFSRFLVSTSFTPFISFHFSLVLFSFFPTYSIYFHFLFNSPFSLHPPRYRLISPLVSLFSLPFFSTLHSFIFFPKYYFTLPFFLSHSLHVPLSRFSLSLLCFSFYSFLF